MEPRAAHVIYFRGDTEKQNKKMFEISFAVRIRIQTLHLTSVRYAPDTRHVNRAESDSSRMAHPTFSVLSTPPI